MTATAPASDPLLLALSPTEVDIVSSCYQHRLLSTAHVAALHTPAAHLRYPQRLLAGLEKRGWLSRVRGRPPARQSLWFTTEAAAKAVEAADIVSRPYRMDALRATGPLQPHTLGVNDVGVAFVAAARRLGHECTPRDWHHEVAHRVSDRPRPGYRADLVVDALLSCTIREEAQEAVILRFIEFDRATESVATVVAKLRGYAAFLSYEPRTAGQTGLAWKARYMAFPKVLLVLGGRSEAALDRRRDTLLQLCRADTVLARAGESLGISITTLQALQRDSPFAGVFRRPGDPSTPVDVLGRCVPSSGGCESSSSCSKPLGSGAGGPLLDRSVNEPTPR